MTPTTNNDAVTNEQSASYTFLEAILHKDVVTLRKYGVDDKTTAQINLKTQIDVAQKLLAADNNQRRSTSKRLQVLSATQPAPANTVTQAPAPQTQRAVFQRWSTPDSPYAPKQSA